MTESHSFNAVIEAVEGGGAYVTIPFDVEAAFGKKRVPVVVTIDGEPYRGSLVRMGGCDHILGITKEIQARIGKQPRDIVGVTITEDMAPRVVEVPADLSAALDAAPQAKAFFGGLSYSHQREYVRWIDEAKREETRSRRVTSAVEMLTQGRKR